MLRTRLFPGIVIHETKEVLQAFIEAFNRADADALANLYAENAINHQVAESPVEGREAIRRMFVESFSGSYGLHCREPV